MTDIFYFFVDHNTFVKMQSCRECKSWFLPNVPAVAIKHFFLTTGLTDPTRLLLHAFVGSLDQLHSYMVLHLQKKKIVCTRGSTYYTIKSNQILYGLQSCTVGKKEKVRSPLVMVVVTRAEYKLASLKVQGVVLLVMMMIVYVCWWWW